MASPLRVATAQPDPPERSAAFEADIAVDSERERLFERPGEGRRLAAVLRDLGKLDEAQVEFVLEQQEHSPRSFGEVAISLGLVTAAEVRQALAHLHAVEFQPAPAGVEAGVPKELSSLADATSSTGEALRALRSQLMLRWFGPAIEQHTLAVVSPDARDGRSHICAALSMLIAQMDEDVLLLDADLRRPRLHELFGIDNTIGLSAWLRAPGDRPQVYGVAGQEHLHLLPAGPPVRNPNELIGHRRFGLLLESLAQRYSFILIDTPPAMLYAEALTIAVRSSGCLLLTRRHRSRLADAQEVAGTLTKHGVEMVGAVINDY
jgi:chain length determinant protein tyrosine kinase EpsG